MLTARLSLILALIFIAIGAIGVIESGFDKAKTGLIVGVVFALGMMIPFFMGRKGKPAANKVATILSVIFAIAIAGRFAPTNWIPAIKGEGDFGLAGMLGLAMFAASVVFFFLFRKVPSRV